MLESARRSMVLPQVPVRWLLGVGTMASFGWLLVNDRIHPIVVYAFELYLAF